MLYFNQDQKNKKGDKECKKRKEYDGYTKRLVNIEEFMQYTGLGRNKSGKSWRRDWLYYASRKRVLYDIRKADQYFDALTEVK